MDISYIKNNRSKNLKITLKPNGTVRVTLPRFCSQRRAEAFVEKKRDWISAHLQDFKEKYEVLEQADKHLLRQQAKKILPRRVAELAQNFGFEYGRVTIRDTSSRWGSCSSKKNISLSLRLMKVSDVLRDYVILHELCHTVHMHHQKEFWDLLESVCPGSKSFDKALKNQRII